MLSTSTSKDIQDVVLGVEATTLSQRPDGTTHSLVGYFNESKSDFMNGRL